MIPARTSSSHERSVPDLHRRRVAVVAEDVQGRGVEQEVLASDHPKADPARDQRSQHVAVREQRYIAGRIADAGDDAIDARANLLR
jgi:hypothetical protein